VISDLVLQIDYHFPKVYFMCGMQVRSITLDVRVWENTILELFDNLGNTYCNSIWEGLLLLDNER